MGSSVIMHPNRQSEEDQNLKNELETLVERLKVRYDGGKMLMR